MSTRSAISVPAVRDDELAAARGSAVVLWRGQPIPFDRVPERIAAMSGRAERDALYGSWVEALEALNPRYEARLAAWMAAGDPVEAAARSGTDPRSLVGNLERFVLHAETPYYAALRRNLALVDIEQGDATEADLWHVVRGSAWSHWFGSRDVARSVAAVAGGAPDEPDGDGWQSAEASLAGRTGAVLGERIVGEARRSLAGSPAWLRDELGVVNDEVPAFVDFAAFVRLWRLQRDIGRLRYELRLFATPDAPVARAYYTGILGHMTGVAVHEAGYLHAVPAPFASILDVEAAVLAGALIDVLESRWGDAWWRAPDSAAVLDDMASAASTGDALARLGYDALDWRPVLRQIRTRLIGEMSGYGGPNITTRAGTRKV